MRADFVVLDRLPVLGQTDHLIHRVERVLLPRPFLQQKVHILVDGGEVGEPPLELFIVLRETIGFFVWVGDEAQGELLPGQRFQRQRALHFLKHRDPPDVRP